MNKLDEQYRGILAELLYNGKEKKDRTGTGTLSKFGIQIRHKMSDGFPLLTTKRMAVKTMMTELKWFLKGDTNIKYLVDNNCNIWNGDAYKNYASKSQTLEVWNSDGTMTATSPASHYDFLTQKEFIEKIKTDDEFAKKWGELGPIYGKQWRSWKGDTWLEGNTDGTEGSYLQSKHIDQIQNLINELKTNPDSRRLMVSAWNVDEVDQMTLPPCHYGFQVYTRELSIEDKIRIYALREGQTYEEFITNWDTEEQWLEDLSDTTVPTRAISLMWNQRSVDTFLGLPFNIASYGMLLELIASEVNMVPDELVGNLGDVHLYNNHVEQAKEQISRDGFDLPTIKLSNVYILNGEFDYELINYQSATAIKAPLSN